MRVGVTQLPQPVAYVMQAMGTSHPDTGHTYMECSELSMRVLLLILKQWYFYTMAVIKHSFPPKYVLIIYVRSK
jgi:hypothetical protein